MVELFLLGAFLAIVFTGIRRFKRTRGGSGRRLRCHDCRHLLRAFDDGARCGLRGGDVFKTPVHIANCMDWEQR
jgi:hypothetical protein